METNNLLGALSRERKALDKTSDPIFSVMASSETDIVIKKDTGRSRSLLIIMPSSGVFCIRDTKGKTKPLTPENYVVFTRGLKDKVILAPEGFWISMFRSGIDFGRTLCSALENENIIALVKKKALSGFDVTRSCCNGNNIQRNGFEGRLNLLLSAYSNCPGVFESVMTECTSKGRNFFIHYSKTIACLAEMYSEKEALDFVKSFDNSSLGKEYEPDTVAYTFYLLPTPPMRYIQDYEKLCIHSTYENESTGCAFPLLGLEYETFKKYAINAAQRMGYTANYDDFIQDWHKAVSAGFRAFGTIDEKTPDDLCSYIRKADNSRIGFEYNRMDTLFQARQQAACSFEGEYGGYIFKAPKSMVDYDRYISSFLFANHIYYRDSLSYTVAKAVQTGKDRLISENPVVAVFRSDFKRFPAAVLYVDPATGITDMFTDGTMLGADAVSVFRKWIDKCTNKDS